MRSKLAVSTAADAQLGDADEEFE
ncbi:MAG: hypothetical protein QG612_1684, partial [Pseudomonadota bacterium]|nr:hypothetical protein [Pseudomonadota bacterium]